MKKVLITGASGFIGYHLIRSSLQKGLEVYAATRKNSVIRHLKALPITFVTIDYHNKAKIKELFKDHQFDYIIHNAGITKGKNEREFLSVNAEITKLLVDVLEEGSFKPSNFVFISSLAAMGPALSFNAPQLKVSNTPRPISSYGKSKLMAEAYIANTRSLNYTIFRPTAVYGPFEKDLLSFIRVIKLCLEPYMGRAEQKLSFVYVEDLANLIINSLEFASNRKIYLVSDGNIYGRYEFAEIVKRYLQNKTLKIHLPLTLVNVLASTLEVFYKVLQKAPPLSRDKIKEMTAMNWSCDTREAIDDYNYLPRFNLNEGLNRTLDWYIQNRWIQ